MDALLAQNLEDTQYAPEVIPPAVELRGPDLRVDQNTGSEQAGVRPANFMNGRHNAGWMGLLLAAGIALAGCGKGGSGTGGSGFDNASPEIKAAWDKAVAADKANDYVPAVLGYKQILLQRDQLSEAQVKAVEEASGKLMQRIVEASTKGDAAARQAISQLQPGRPGQAPSR